MLKKQKSSDGNMCPFLLFEWSLPKFQMLYKYNFSFVESIVKASYIQWQLWKIVIHEMLQLV